MKSKLLNLLEEEFKYRYSPRKRESVADKIIALFAENENSVLDCDKREDSVYSLLSQWKANLRSPNSEIAKEYKAPSLSQKSKTENSCCSCQIPWGKHDYRCMECDDLNPNHPATMKGL